MGRGITEITMAQLEGVVGTYSNVIWMNDPSDTDLVKTIVGQPRTIIINLGQLLNIASGDIQGDAIAIDELEATEIADDAITGSELAETPSLFQTATAVTHDHDTGTGATLIAANAAGEGDRMVICQVEVTEAFVATSYEVDVGSTADPNGLFDDIFEGLGTLAINETLVGAYLLPEGEALTLTETGAFVGDTAGQWTFRFLILAPAAGSIPGALLADDAIGNFENVAAVAVDHAAGSPVELLAADAANDRLCLIMGIATETATGGPDIDVGSAVTAVNAAFDDISGGTWVLGERWQGACMLPAGEALNATIVGAGTAGAIDFYVIPLIVTQAGAKNLFETVTSTVTQDHADGSKTLVAANAAGEGDRLVICQAEVTEAFVVATSWDIDVGSTADTAGLFADIFAGDLTVGIGESVVGVYLLPEGEALDTLENDMTGDTAGVITFRLNIVTLGAGSIPGALLANDAIGHFAPSGVMGAAVGLAHDAVSPFELLAADANNDRLVMVMAVATETAAGTPDIDIGSETTDPNAVFDDLAAGAWVLGERFMGGCLLPAGEALDATITVAGTAGEFDIYLVVLPMAVQTAQIADAAVTGIKLAATPNLFETATVVTQDHDTGGPATLLAANAAGGGDRLVIVQAEVTEAFATTSWEWDVGSTANGDGLFDDIFVGVAALALGETLMGAYLLPEGEALVLTETDMTGDTTGQITFRIMVTDAAAGSIPGALLADDAIGLFEDITPTAVAFGGGATQQILASDANNNRHVLVMAIAQVAAESGVCDWDVGVGAGNEVFDDISGGTWIAGERWMGACDLPAGSALNVTLQTAGAAGEIDFYVIALTPLVETAQITNAAVTGVKLASVGSLFDGAAGAVTVIERDYADGTPQQLLAANAATAGDRLILVQAHVTEAFVLTSYDWDVGSTTDPNGLFDDLFAGLATIGLRESELSAYILPAGEALQLLEIEQTDGGAPAGKVTFRILDLGAVVTARIADNAITPDKVLDIASESAEAGVGIKQAMAEYTFSNLAADAGMFGATSIPSGSLVLGGYLEVVTTLTETNGGGEVDVGLEIEGAGDLIADTAWNGAPWSTVGFKSLIPAFTGATAILTTAPRDITISIVLNGATNIAGGVIRVVLFYIEPKTGAV